MLGIALVATTAMAETPAGSAALQADVVISRLPQHQRSFTVSGHSAGGTMASQHAIAFSDRVTGLGHYQAAPWGCSRLLLDREDREVFDENFNSRCVGSDAQHALVAMIHRSFAHGGIADPANLRRMPIFFYSGLADTIVNASTVETAAAFYELLSDNVVGVRIPHARHSIVVTNCSVCNPCGKFGPPFLNACSYDAAGKTFAHLLGTLVPPTEAPADHVWRIDQRAFYPAKATDLEMGMGPHAFLYMPHACREDRTRCRLHVFYHGCYESVTAVRETDRIPTIAARTFTRAHRGGGYRSPHAQQADVFGMCVCWTARPT